MRIIHAKIYTMSGPVIKDGFVDTLKDQIVAVGPMKELPKLSAGEVIDAQGAMLLPGFIDSHTHIGICEDSLGFEGDDINEQTDPCTPQLRALDAVNPLDYCFEEAVRAGVTSVVTGPGSANPIGGQLVAMKTYGRFIDDMVIKAPVAMKFALGENPKSVYHEKNEAPTTRMATAALIREQLSKTREYIEKKKRAQEEGELCEFDAKLEALEPLFTKGLPMHIHAHRADDICTAMRIAGEFGLNYAIVHCTQGHKLADVLAQKHVAAMSGPLISERCKPELHELTPATPGILQKAGVRISIITDHPVIPIQYLPLCAGLAVREGLPYKEALRAITLTPAEICGISNRVGSIEPGKDADFSIFDCDPLTIAAKPALVVGGGKMLHKAL